MTKSSPSRTSRRALTPLAALALAMGPWGVALGCNVYEAGLLDGSAAAAGATAEGGSGSGAEAGSKAGEGAAAPTAGNSSMGAEGGMASAGAAGSESGGSSSGATGGTASAGSAGSSAGSAPVSDPDAIDDMEDDDAQIATVPGRNGYWYVGNDGTEAGTQEPTVGMFMMTALTADERPNSAYAARMKVEGFTGWGSVLGLNFFEQLGKVKAFDATEYCGVRYWGRAAAATTVRFRLPDGDTHPEGGVCVDGGPAGQACYDHFGVSAAFTSEWKEFTTMFDAVEQVGNGYQPADMKLKADQLFSLEWSLPGGAGKAYEIWIDDVSFLSCP